MSFTVIGLPDVNIHCIFQSLLLFVNTLKSTGLYALNERVIWYMKYISIKLRERRRRERGEGRKERGDGRMVRREDRETSQIPGSPSEFPSRLQKSWQAFAADVPASGSFLPYLFLNPPRFRLLWPTHLCCGTITS